ncbi:MAG TPA: FecR domain-containing protein [Balneolaceae bacterium]|nr:FecR domain-containing protein [Balneolaceae bacterium]
MNEEIPWNLLARYFAGELDGLGKKRFEEWIIEDPARAGEIEKLREFWDSRSMGTSADSDVAWDRLSQRIDLEERKKQQEKIVQLRYQYEESEYRTKSQRIQKSAKVIVLVAASLLIVAFAGFLAYQSNVISDHSELAETGFRVLITKNGEQATYRLIDGTRVILHAGSRLEIPNDYNQNERKLTVEGEAFFDVVHDPGKPFIVQSAYAYTEVLGTRFLVQAWKEEDSDIGVVVEEGRVLFGDLRAASDDQKKEVILTKNQQGVINPRGDLEVFKHEDLSWYTGWLEERLVFENRELKEILPRLERWYDIEIMVDDPALLSERITAEIDYTLPMTDVIQGLAMILHTDVDRDGRRIVLQEK